MKELTEIEINEIEGGRDIYEILSYLCGLGIGAAIIYSGGLALAFLIASGAVSCLTAIVDLGILRE